MIIVAHGTSCEIYPSGYAYLPHSVYSHERASANCRNYPPGLQGNFIYTENYVYCNGTQLRLIDSDIGSEQYSNSEYYEWSAETRSQLLFIFPTRINLTNITLHYFSDSVRDLPRGLPRLRFYAVPDNFNVWDAPISSYIISDIAAVTQSSNVVGRRNVSVGFNVTTIKLLMYKFRSTYSFAVSEVEFFNHTCKQATCMLHY